MSRARPEPLDERWIPLEGCYNFRDLGGYATADGRRVRRGRLYRSDGLQLLTDADVRRIEDELGVRAVIDLRTDVEVDTDGVGKLAVDRHHLPIFDSEPRDGAPPLPVDLGELYFAMIRFARKRIARVLDCIASQEDPTIFHCAAGKDRTGVVGAVILGLLGVEERDIVDDYAFTSRNLDRIVARLEGSDGYAVVYRELPPETLHAAPETMASLLARTRERYGSMREYARFAGVGDGTLARLEARLLEPS